MPFQPRDYPDDIAENVHALRYTGTNYSEIEAALVRLGASEQEADGLTDILHVEGWGGRENDDLTDDVLHGRIEWFREGRAVKGGRA